MTRLFFTRSVAVTLAVLAVVLLVQVGSHVHVKGRADTACQVCHAAHLSVGLAESGSSFVLPLIVAGLVRPLAATFQLDLFSHDSPSRAPPTL